jgi:hypothetical protein
MGLVVSIRDSQTAPPTSASNSKIQTSNLNIRDLFLARLIRKARALCPIARAYV